MKALVRAILGKVGLEVHRIPRPVPDPEWDYASAGGIPWSLGYEEAKHRFIAGVAADRGLLQLFRDARPLPPGFGLAFDERCVEYPWLLSRLRPEPEAVLDAGSTLNHALILDHPRMRNKRLHILTLGPEGRCFWERGVSYLYDDLRDIPIRDGYYATAVCISTLEHVGCDNTLFTRDELHREHRPEDFACVMRELRRVLTPGGRLFLSVPFGVYRHFGAFQQFDRQLLSRAIDAFGTAAEMTETFYRYTPAGWNVADQADCANCEYVEWVAAAWLHGVWPYPLPVEADRAAAARAVACVQLTKT